MHVSREPASVHVQVLTCSSGKVLARAGEYRPARCVEGYSEAGVATVGVERIPAAHDGGGSFCTATLVEVHRYHGYVGVHGTCDGTGQVSGGLSVPVRGDCVAACAVRGCGGLEIEGGRTGGVEVHGDIGAAGIARVRGRGPGLGTGGRSIYQDATVIIEVRVCLSGEPGDVKGDSAREVIEALQCLHIAGKVGVDIHLAVGSVTVDRVGATERRGCPDLVGAISVMVKTHLQDVGLDRTGDLSVERDRGRLGGKADRVTALDVRPGVLGDLDVERGRSGGLEPHGVVHTGTVLGGLCIVARHLGGARGTGEHLDVVSRPCVLEVGVGLA